MIIKYKYIYIYLLISFVELLVLGMPFKYQWIRYITKPLLMILLMTYVYNALSYTSRKNILLILFFAWLGDVFLMFSHPIFFPLGLLSFLVMQILYIRNFAMNLKFNQINRMLDGVVGILFLGYVFFFLNLLWSGVGAELKIPVILYGISLGSMAFFAFLRKSYDTSISYKIVFLGAVFFVISDSLLAYNKFVSTFNGNSFYVMGTYILAQLLLIVGLVNFVIRKRLNVQ